MIWGGEAPNHLDLSWVPWGSPPEGFPVVPLGSHGSPQELLLEASQGEPREGPNDLEG